MNIGKPIEKRAKKPSNRRPAAANASIAGRSITRRGWAKRDSPSSAAISNM